MKSNPQVDCFLLKCMQYKTNIRKQWKLRKFSFALETLFMGLLVDKKIASTLQTLTRKVFFKF